MAADAECPERGHIAERRRLSPVRRDDAVGDRVGVAIPARPAAGSREPPLRERLQRSAMDGQPARARRGPGTRRSRRCSGMRARLLIFGIASRSRSSRTGTAARRTADHDDRRAHRNTLLENARLLGALDVAMADAAIGCWDAKYTYNFWRPITAIQELADDGNPFDDTRPRVDAALHDAGASRLSLGPFLCQRRRCRRPGEGVRCENTVSRDVRFDAGRLPLISQLLGRAR